MSTNNTNNPNTERLNAMLRRSSERLRGGSVPPLDSEQTINPSRDTNQSAPATRVGGQRGRGCGRGHQNAEGLTRPTNQNSPSGDQTPAVTLTVPGSNGSGNATPNMSLRSGAQPESGLSTTNQTESSGQIAHTSKRTTIIHPPGESPAGLISRDNVSNKTNSKRQFRTSPP